MQRGQVLGDVPGGHPGESGQVGGGERRRRAGAAARLRPGPITRASGSPGGVRGRLPERPDGPDRVRAGRQRILQQVPQHVLLGEHRRVQRQPATAEVEVPLERVVADHPVAEPAQARVELLEEPTGAALGELGGAGTPRRRRAAPASAASPGRSPRRTRPAPRRRAAAAARRGRRAAPARTGSAVGAGWSPSRSWTTTAGGVAAIWSSCSAISTFGRAAGVRKSGSQRPGTDQLHQRSDPVGHLGTTQTSPGPGRSRAGAPRSGPGWPAPTCS